MCKSDLVTINRSLPHTDKGGFLYHTRLGLVGWISSAGIQNREKRVTDIVVRELKGPNLVRGGAYRLAKCGQLRRRLKCGLDTFGSASSGRFLVT
jgi:hypothetical protein